MDIYGLVTNPRSWLSNQKVSTIYNFLALRRGVYFLGEEGGFSVSYSMIWFLKRTCK